MHDQFLRPEFTALLARALQNGEAVNLISPHGQGRRRTLADLRVLLSCTLKILQCNLRDYPDDAAGLLDDLCRQADCDKCTFPALSKQASRTEKMWLIVLHNFDELIPGNNSGYDNSLFSELQTLAALPNIALLCVSENPIHSTLPWCQPLPLPSLTTEQIKAEINRTNPELTTQEKIELALRISKSTMPYSELAKVKP